MVELVLAISLIAIIAIVVISIFINYLSLITHTNAQIDMTVDSQNLLRASAEELRYGSGVRQTNAITDSNSPSGGWNTGNANFVIITAVPAIDNSGNYIMDPSTGDPYANELVYFKQSLTLYKRTLAHPSAVGNKLVTTCPKAIATAACPADRELVDFVKTMVFTLYDQDNVVTPNALRARSVNINLLLERTVYGKTLIYDNNIRVTLRNHFQ